MEGERDEERREIGAGWGASGFRASRRRRMARRRRWSVDIAPVSARSRSVEDDRSSVVRVSVSVIFLFSTLLLLKDVLFLKLFGVWCVFKSDLVRWMVLSDPPSWPSSVRSSMWTVENKIG